MKKILAAAMLCAVSSAFAAWDMFPVKPAGNGEAKLGVEYKMPAEKVSYLGLNLGVRYTIIEGLEAAVMLGGDGGFAPSGFTLMSDYDGNDLEETGLTQPVIGVRYWLPFGLGIFADVALPFGSEDVVGDEPDVGLAAGVQFSTNITEEFSIGSQAGLQMAFDDPSSGMDLALALEVNYAIGMITPKLGVDFVTGLTEGDMPESAPAGFGLFAGVNFDITEMFYAEVGAWFGLAGDRYDTGSTPINIAASFGVNF